MKVLCVGGRNDGKYVEKAENDMRRLRTDAERLQRKIRARQWTE